MMLQLDTHFTIPLAVNPSSSPNSLLQSMFFAPSSDREVKAIIQSLKNKKPNPHDIPVKIFEILADILSPQISHLFNECLTPSCYPDLLKKARLIPVFKKKGNPQCIDNHRSIFNLLNLNKIFEKLIYNPLT